MKEFIIFLSYTEVLSFFRMDIETKSGEETKDVIIQLSQRDSRSLLMENKETLIIGFTILKVESNRKYRLHQFTGYSLLYELQSMADNKGFISKGIHLPLPSTL